VTSSPDPQLHPIGSPVSDGDGAQGSATFSPSGGLLAVADLFGDEVTVYSVDSETGALTPIDALTGKNAVAFNGNGRLLAVNSGPPADYGNGTVDFYNVDETTDTITPSTIRPVVDDPNGSHFDMVFGDGALAVASQGGNGLAPEGELNVFKRVG
jgi:hypothetical protein